MNRSRNVAAAVLVAAAWLVAGLALSRLLYEWRFPAWLWLGRAGPAALCGAVGAAGGLLLARRFGRAFTWASAPLLLNLLWLLDPAVDLPRGRFLFAAGWWLAAGVWVWLRLGPGHRHWLRLGPAFIAAALLPVYLLTMSSAVGAADTFEFQVVAPQLGIAHPTGYPLYLLLSKLFSLLPVGTVAWRLNFASAVYATLAAIVVFRLAHALLGRPLPALAGAVALGITPVVWSQAIVAEVYTLHALLVAVALGLMLRLVTERRTRSTDRRKTVVALAFTIGLGLTNHLTSVFLLPPAALAVALRLWRDRGERQRDLPVRPAMRVLVVVLAFAAPLLLYLYLPLRWRAVNGEPMGAARFVEWVAGGRFQGALQPLAWLRDPARWEIVGRLLLDAWGVLFLLLALVGLAWLLWRAWRAAAVLALAAAGFLFYALNYYVPDLAVFLIAAHMVVAVFVAAGLTAIVAALEAVGRRARGQAEGVARWAAAAVFVLALLPLFLAAGGAQANAGRWHALDQSADDGGEPWARVALAGPLAHGAAVLADSEKIAPLYYLQQIEGLRPDLDIMVLPDEAAYRAEVDARLAAGGAVYLARYLPGLAGVYTLRSAGPLVEVSTTPLTALPDDATPAGVTVGPLRLLGYQVGAAPDEGSAVAITLFWTQAGPAADSDPSAALHLRWANPFTGAEAPVVSGQHPVGNTYPLNAWRPGEIVADHYILPLPLFDCADAAGCPVALQAAVAPRFGGDAPAWTTLARLPLRPPAGPVVGPAFRAMLGAFRLDGATFPRQVRPGTPLAIRYSGSDGGTPPAFALRPAAVAGEAAPGGGVISLLPAGASRQYAAEVATDLPAGRYRLVARPGAGGAALCGWLSLPRAGCTLGEVEISGAPLPAGAANFDDRVALLAVAVDADGLVPGGQLPVTLTWQGLAPMTENYTVFVQVLDAADRLVGQVDAWPVQGTFPTSQWTPGEVVRDPYLVQLAAELPPGDYRLHVGLYVLATMARLPVLDAGGTAVDDKVEVPIR